MDLGGNAVALGRDSAPAGLVDQRIAAPAASTSRVSGKAGYVPEIDALRGLAMTLVIVFHCKLLPFGWMGVWLFYVVSGFAVTTSLLGGRHRAAGTGTAIRAFYVRRALRIWPLYYVFIALNVAALLALGMAKPLEDVPWLLSFTYNLKMIVKTYTGDNQWAAFGHLWTLAVEQQFYLLFPLLLLLSARASRAAALLAVILAAPLIRAAIGHWATSRGWDAERAAFAVYAFAPAHFDAFAIGTLIAMYRAEIGADSRIAYAAMVAAVAIAVAHIGVYGAIGLREAGHLTPDALRNIVSGILYGQGREVTGYFIPVSIGAAILIGILSGQRHCLRLCRLPGLQAIGRVSYGGYVLHIPVLMLLGALVPIFGAPLTDLRSGLGHVGLLVCAYPLIIGAAWLSFTFFEQPLARLGRRYG